MRVVTERRRRWLVVSMRCFSRVVRSASPRAFESNKQEVEVKDWPVGLVMLLVMREAERLVGLERLLLRGEGMSVAER